jgi:hypothetical protein
MEQVKLSQVLTKVRVRIKFKAGAQIQIFMLSSVEFKQRFNVGKGGVKIQKGINSRAISLSLTNLFFSLFYLVWSLVIFMKDFP